MERSQIYDVKQRENKSHRAGTSVKAFSVTRAASVYVIALLLGGLSIFSLFLLPHSGLVIFGCAVAIVFAAIGALYSVRSVVNSLRA